MTALGFFLTTHVLQIGPVASNHHQPSTSYCKCLYSFLSPIKRKTRGRGPTRCLNGWNSEDKISIATNELGQTIGPEAPKLTNFLGTIARIGHMATLNYVDWRALPEANKENSLGKKWKDWKAELKANHCTNETDEERLADRDESIERERSVRNKAIHSLQMTSHTTGLGIHSNTLICAIQLRAKRPDGKELSLEELFILTRTRKHGPPINEASSALISELREQAVQQQGGPQNGPVGDDVFFTVMGEDRHGRVGT
ncbi:uncharacterized protein LOC130787012 [Actinidia eriantha]|uniref:uncharacterized protein LOC130787012 n=1 Tax=Actinidia eriantha TaxID=165200 RepID=UPI002589006C|nr:uncharacterized protein LOC130787012 [Actinidia eriantha]